jgi:hypothetical protein
MSVKGVMSDITRYINIARIIFIYSEGESILHDKIINMYINFIQL